ncbi:MAG TPA: hypothetical protein VJJ20_02445 [Candidatus Paceibacterota bacterium]
MDLDLQQQVQKRLAELPQDVQAAVRSAELGQKVQAIGKKHALHIDQVGKLEDEVYLVMLGFADPSEFAASLAEELGLAKDQAVEVVTEVTHDIFMPIRASMQQWAEEQTSKEDAHLVTEALAAKEPPSNKPAIAAPTTPFSAPIPSPKPDLLAAETMLAEKKVSAPTPTAPKPNPDPARPQNYKADPYREPAE